MAIAHNMTTELYYEIVGEPTDPVLLLINGLGSQLITYEPGFCELLVASGLQVVRFDNRDVGLSSKTSGSVPNPTENMARFRSGDRADDAAYTLSDMAADAFAVLDAVGADRAHVAGMSMGGMICQRMAIENPDRVLSITSIMSTTGGPSVGGADPDDDAVLLSPAPSDRAGYIEHIITARAVNGGTHYSADAWRIMAADLYDRNHHPTGPAFQVHAMAAEPDRTAQLQLLDVPALVIHGRLDRLIDLSGGVATAAAIPGAKLLVIDSMGHDLPQPLWAQISDAMIELTSA